MTGATEDNHKTPTMEKQEPDQLIKYSGWKAMPYVIGNETCEKLGTLGTVANLLIYLTTIYHVKSVTAATMLNLFSGTTNITPVIGAFLSDTYLGRYTTLGFASIASFVGMLILTLTATIRTLHPPHCDSSDTASDHHCRGPTTLQLLVLLSGFFFLVVGAGGIRPCNLAFGADQFDPRTESGRRGINSFFNWYYFTFTVAMMVSATVIIYVQSNISWSIGLAIPAALMFLSCAFFFVGTPIYVVVAAIRKRRVQKPPIKEGEEEGAGGRDLFDLPHRSALVTKLPYTDQFRFLDKAAIVIPSDELKPNGEAANRWRLCTLQQVEEVKCVARIIPVWSAAIVFYVATVQQSTYTVYQALQSDRRLIGKFEIPAASFVVFSMLALTVWIPIYDRILVPLLRRLTGKDEGLTLLQRMGIGMVLAVVAMVVAALVEDRRRSYAVHRPLLGSRRAGAAFRRCRACGSRSSSRSSASPRLSR
uniref:Protein NRT1/ PTR FAMILY 2.11 n=1 Tax=Ananas comosus var. bracteatus TaxID=296719 RepID=A0A6V7QFK7_ANACO|nr:unnamed protein product [Ananas comosus var. bracteatus]